MKIAEIVEKLADGGNLTENSDSLFGTNYLAQLLHFTEFWKTSVPRTSG
jgi:hypothetical protein